MRSSGNIAEAETLVSQHLAGRNELLDNSDIREAVAAFSSLLTRLYSLNEEDLELLVRSIETRFVTTMGIGISLIDQSLPHNEEWYSEHDLKKDYWDDYKQYLIRDGLPPPVISSVDKVTDKLLGLIRNPTDEGEWERRGLVIGHVQSGKTANYIGLLTKAADAGYKFIVVIAGIHNNLRTQTQERIDAGFIGRDTETQQPKGVGLLRPNRLAPASVTTTRSDFNKSLAKRFIMQLQTFNTPFIIVIKKNASTLSSLYEWLKQSNTASEIGRITDIPMLMIDDEADNASVNTNQPNLDPTRINREIRRILSLFRKRSYVGYTATPFANIFINPDDTDERLGANLFPEHFIYCLDAPSNYFGAEKIFQVEDSTPAFVRIIEDAGSYLPVQHRREYQISSLPPSMTNAVLVFILSRTIRNLRGQTAEHCSMMINASRFVAIQRDLSDIIAAYVEDVRKAVNLNYSLPTDTALKDPMITSLYDTFNAEYANAKCTWQQVQSGLREAVSAVRIIVVNSRSDELLDYEAYTREGTALTAIVIGGLSLSRGLTIQGLTVSYMYRNTQMYDTLMQMGRWFGYRPYYEDLCRIFLSEDSYAWYSYIAEATEELRNQIKRMRRDRKKPSDFGLYVRAHPDTLLVTARNKMRHAELRDLVVSYDGKLMETFVIPESDDKNQTNMTLITDFFENLQIQQKPAQDNSLSWLFTDIYWEQIFDLLSDFRFHQQLIHLTDYVPKFVKEISDLYRYWDVSFRSKGLIQNDDFLVTPQRRTVGSRKPLGEAGWYTGNKNRFSGNDMFEIGLNDSQKLAAKQSAADAGRKAPIFSDYTNARGKPLLILHLLQLTDNIKKPVKDSYGNLLETPVPALSVSFPNCSEFRSIRYVVNPVWLKLLDENVYDTPAEEEDYEYDS